MRFYDVGSGSITIDGVDIKTMSRTHLRSLFGMVLQDTWLFHGSIEDNIRFGSPHATTEELVASSKATHADHSIRSLPDGYQHLMNEEGDNISGGEKQLITIARAMLKEPPMLILDEATSSVDTRTEVLIQNAMIELMGNKTSFVIAHRLSTIKNADLILVMNDGAIVEHGTHTKLLTQNGFYATLYQSQFG
jgi:ATP-binding cassette, subfamily B, multidrug efflux pump